MFVQRVRGRSVASLVRELNERGVPCPSNTDPRRNRHRCGDRWIVRTVAMILENPRYTGRQVWNRRSTTGHSTGSRHSGRGSGALRSNPTGEWDVSDSLTHAPLVDDTTFLAVQGIRSSRPSKDGQTRRYLLARLVVCEACGRRLDAHWIHGRAAYRCRHGYTRARSRPAGAARNVYHREDQLVAALHGLLADIAAWTTPTSAGVRPDPVDVLRRVRLQIVCSHQVATLGREPSSEPTRPASARQDSVRTGTEFADDGRPKRYVMHCRARLEMRGIGRSGVRECPRPEPPYPSV